MSGKRKQERKRERAAIYIRVSSEKQANKASPDTQEQDCRDYCRQRGYAVIAVYRDIERYRTGKKLVEPSGERADRPALRRMLADGAAGKFDVIIAWREDRLYRGMRPMLDVLDCIEENDLDIELVKETFDRTVAPVKAWAARMELDAKHDRTMMGIANRLASGKTWNNNTPYGYRSDDGSLHLDAEQAEVVRSIWTWYADDVAVAEIRRRLISSGAPQVQDGHKIPWKPAYIRALLRRQCYHTGLYTITWDGETYEIPIPPIIDAETAARVKQRRAGFKKYPAGNLRSQVLAAGLVYCEACGIKMMVSPHSQRKNGKEYRYVYYACPYKSRGTHQPGCAGWVRYERIDAELWDRVWALISDPDRFEAALQERIAFLQAQDIDAEAECSRLQEALDNLMMERQRVITWARKKLITEDDMELQLGGLQFQEMGLKRELAEKSLLVGGQAQRLQELARLYREDVQTGAAILTGEPETEEEEKLQFEFRQKIVQELVKRVDVGADRSLTIQAELNFAAREFVDQDQACLLGK